MTIDIVVIGYHSDAYLDRLQSDLALYTRHPCKFQYFDNSRDQINFSMLQNDLAARGDAEYIFFLNPDVAVTPGWDERLIAFLDSHPETAAVLPLPVGDQRSRELWLPYVSGDWPEKVLPDNGTMERLAEELKENQGFHVFDVRWLFCPFFAFLIRRSVFETLKGFDERLRFLGCDWEMNIRITEYLGLTVAGPHNCAFFHIGAASIHEAKERKKFFYRREKNIRDKVLRQIREGKSLRWHQLSDAERTRIRLREEFRFINGRVDMEKHLSEDDDNKINTQVT